MLKMTATNEGNFFSYNFEENSSISFCRAIHCNDRKNEEMYARYYTNNNVYNMFKCSTTLECVPVLTELLHVISV